jgi:hypothetical protein
MDALLHALGFCGESHPSLLWLLMGGAGGLSYGALKVWLKSLRKCKDESCKCECHDKENG